MSTGGVQQIRQRRRRRRWRGWHFRQRVDDCRRNGRRLVRFSTQQRFVRFSNKQFGPGNRAAYDAATANQQTRFRSRRNDQRQELRRRAPAQQQRAEARSTSSALLRVALQSKGARSSPPQTEQCSLRCCGHHHLGSDQDERRVEQGQQVRSPERADPGFDGNFESPDCFQHPRNFKMLQPLLKTISDIRFYF